MYYNKFQDKSLSALGLGAMRLPLLPDGSGKIDEEMTAKMIDYALKNGVNYFDTAVPYHGGESERVVGEILSKYPRESYFLATKFPGHMVAESYDPAATFEEQLAKCKVDYFDFYLLHNICENSFDTYKNPKWGIVEYFIEQKKNGKIKHLGFSTHGSVENMKEILDLWGENMEFCQIQLNYLDRTMQNAEEKYDLLTERNIPVWVMEPLRGGKLASLPEDCEKELNAALPGETAVSAAFKYLMGFENIAVILSGMSNMEQLQENIRIFEAKKSLDSDGKNALFSVANQLSGAVPCTSCRYCVDGCPMELDIPNLISLANDFAFQTGVVVRMAVDTLDENKTPQNCISCGKCTEICPQKIDIPSVMKRFSKQLEEYPTWAEICKKRAEEQAKNKAKQK